MIMVAADALLVPDQKPNKSELNELESTMQAKSKASEATTQNLQIDKLAARNNKLQNIHARFNHNHILLQQTTHKLNFHARPIFPIPLFACKRIHYIINSA